MILYSSPVPSSQKGKTLLDSSQYPSILTIPKLFYSRKLLARHDLCRWLRVWLIFGVDVNASFDDTAQGQSHSALAFTTFRKGFTTMATNKELQEQIEALKNQLAAAPRQQTVSVKVGAKGGICICGLGNKFPTTLYYPQLQRFAANLPMILAFAEKAKKEGLLAIKS
jgi:hypothetical protein